MSETVLVWWLGLCLVSLGNLLAWSASAWRLRRPQTWVEAADGGGRADFAHHRLQLVLSGVYVAGCAFRSFFPVFDVPRLCLNESVLSTALIGRTVATLAELCFALQWALLAGVLARRLHDRVVLGIAWGVPLLIVVAEVCSWYSVLSRSNIGHVIEESLWALSAGLLVLSVLRFWPACAARLRPLLALWAAAAACYVVYMVGIDIPMYWGRWQAEAQAGQTPLSLAQGVWHAAQPCVWSGRLEDWRSEMVWMGLYFSVAVWFSISLIRVPLPAQRAVPARHGVPFGNRRASTRVRTDPRLAGSSLSAGVLVNTRTEGE